jgi:hypothetical protein
MKPTRVKRRAFVKAHVGQLSKQASKVKANLYRNSDTFTAPPMDEDAFGALITDYSEKYARYKDGGSTAKGLFMLANTALFSAMDRLANYVNTVANGQLTIILLSGFVPTDSTASRLMRPKVPKNVELKRRSEGQIEALCDHQEIADNYGCIMTEGAPLPISAHMRGNKLSLRPAELAALNIVLIEIDLGKGRKKLFSGLTPGVIYYFIFYAVNASGASSLSPAVSMVCG